MELFVVVVSGVLLSMNGMGVYVLLLLDVEMNLNIWNDYVVFGWKMLILMLMMVIIFIFIVIFVIIRYDDIVV